MVLKRFLFFIMIILLFLFLGLYFVRLVLPKQIDDVNPLMGCSDFELGNVDVLYVVPVYENVAINESGEWCEKILAMNKTIRLHGIYHNYQEFYGEVNESDFEFALEVFKNCFGFYPEAFKAPHLKINSKNLELVESYGLKYEGYFNQMTHRVYHCNNSGKFPNWIFDWF